VPRPKQRTQQLRDHVLQVAVVTLAADGVAGFTTRRVARQAQTSTPAVYELFGDKGGLVRNVFFEGFRMLQRQLAATSQSDDPLADLRQLAQAYRGFMLEHRALAEVMFSRPFSDFSPGPSELQATSGVRRLIVGRVDRCLQVGALSGDATDIAHVLVSMIQGMAAAENAGRLGTTRASVERRWDLALQTVLNGVSA